MSTDFSDADLRTIHSALYTRLSDLMDQVERFETDGKKDAAARLYQQAEDTRRLIRKAVHNMQG